MPNLCICYHKGSNHALLLINNPSVTIRVKIGVNYQDSVRGPIESILVPALESCLIELASRDCRCQARSGVYFPMPPATARTTIILPITSWLRALHGPVWNCHVSDPLSTKFKQRHKSL